MTNLAIHETTNGITDYHKGINTPTQPQQRNKITDEQMFSRSGVPGFLVQGDNFALNYCSADSSVSVGKAWARLVPSPIALRPVSLANTSFFSILFVIGSKFYMEPFRRFGRIHKYMRQIYCRRGVYRY